MKCQATEAHDSSRAVADTTSSEMEKEMFVYGVVCTCTKVCECSVYQESYRFKLEAHCGRAAGTCAFHVFMVFESRLLRLEMTSFFILLSSIAPAIVDGTWVSPW